MTLGTGPQPPRPAGQPGPPALARDRPFSYASSAFVPVRTMPWWLRGFARHQPATPVTETLRGLLLGQPASGPSRSC